MKILKVFLALAVMVLSCKGVTAKVDYESLPKEIHSGSQGKFHCQGIAVDLKRGYVYYSFTTSLLKTDLQGNCIGSVDGIIGHLGCISLNPENGKLYGSLEYKMDGIGAGILKELNLSDQDLQTAFYVAIFDVDKITRKNMNAETDGIMKAVYLKDVVDDYSATVMNKGKEQLHRYGCSGIDGLTIAPPVGKRRGCELYVAYGIYSDVNRTDNDYQVILSYNPKKLDKLAKPLSQKGMHRNGPLKPQHIYFVYTGNTSFGIQNLTYDKWTGNMLAAVYKGVKKDFKNYTLFVIDRNAKAKKQILKGFENGETGEVIPLAEGGHYDSNAGVKGYNTPLGATGLSPIGDGYYYISNHGKDKEGNQNTVLKLYKWKGLPDEPFEEVR